MGDLNALAKDIFSRANQGVKKGDIMAISANNPFDIKETDSSIENCVKVTVDLSIPCLLRQDREHIIAKIKSVTSYYRGYYTLAHWSDNNDGTVTATYKIYISIIHIPNNEDWCFVVHD